MNESLRRVILACTKQTGDATWETRTGRRERMKIFPSGPLQMRKDGRTRKMERERGVERNGGEGRRKRARNTHSLIWAALKDRQAPAPLFILCDPLGSSGWETLEVGSC